MKRLCLKFEVFFCALILVGIYGMNISAAATVKYTKPSAPTNLTTEGGLETVYLKWKAPTNSGGQKITSFRVRIVELQTFYICKSSATSCTVPIKNPNKPSSKPVPVWFSFTVAATNSMGTGPDSAVGQSRVQVRFRASVDLSNKFAPPLPKANPTTKPAPTPSPTEAPTPTTSSTPKASPAPTSTNTASATGITVFDGTYTGNTVVSVYAAGSQTPSLATSLPISFVITNGSGSGVANDWTVTGKVIDSKGVASITAANTIYGSISFNANFAIDGNTKFMGCAGTGSRTVVIPTLGELRVEYSFNVARQT